MRIIHDPSLLSVEGETAELTEVQKNAMCFYSKMQVCYTDPSLRASKFYVGRLFET